MSHKKSFPDNSSIEWVDRETLKYIDGEFSLFVWVDFEPGFFSNGMIIKASSVLNWNTAGNAGIGRTDIVAEILS